MNTLRPASGVRKKRKRLCRGSGSGLGKTGGFGNNGAKSRSGHTTKYYYEGGQTPISRRIPKRGFINRNRVTFQTINIRDLNNLENPAGEITPQWLYDNGMVHSDVLPVKVLGSGSLEKSLHVKAHAFSSTAREKIEKAKGKAEEMRRA